MVSLKTENNIGKIRGLVGNISAEQLSHVEVYQGNNAGIYIPSTGHCGYAVSENHSHPSFSFFYSLDQNVTTIINGKSYETPAGILSVIPPGVTHHEIPGETFTRFTSILIDTAFFKYHAIEYKVAETAAIPGKFKMTDAVRASVREFIAEISSPQTGFDKLLESIEIRLVHALLRAMSGLGEKKSGISMRLEIEKVIAHINANYSRTISIEEMASLIALSPSHFSRLFKKETSVSPQDYLIDIRLTRSRSYLLKTEKNITEIALLCGFASSAHLSSSFRNKFGITPSRFRNKT
jgi:AraC family transcriptional regulator